MRIIGNLKTKALPSWEMSWPTHSGAQCHILKIWILIRINYLLCHFEMHTSLPRLKYHSMKTGELWCLWKFEKCSTGLMSYFPVNENVKCTVPCLLSAGKMGFFFRCSRQNGIFFRCRILSGKRRKIKCFRLLRQGCSFFRLDSACNRWDWFLFSSIERVTRIA